MARHSHPEDIPGTSESASSTSESPESPYSAAQASSEANLESELGAVSFSGTAPTPSSAETPEEDLFEGFEPAWAPTGVLAAAAGTATATATRSTDAAAATTRSTDATKSEHLSKHSKRKPSSLTSRILGVVGELLITVGAIIGLFIVWQVWWTDIEANHQQAIQVEAFVKQYGEVTVEKQGIGDPQDGPPPSFAHTDTEGDILGIMHIPAFGLDYAYTIKEGVGLREVLDTGAFGHYPKTAFPGEIGNFSTAAHRQSYGAPMRNVQDLKVGDPIIVETKDAWLIYKIVGDEIVTPNDWRVVEPDPFAAKAAVDAGGSPSDVTVAPTRRLLTVTTCHPPFVSNDRWAVHAEFSHWVDRADGLPKELADTEETK